jgi:hypothetical protein
MDRARKGQLSSRLSWKESQELLIMMTNIYPQTTICIDALDETEEEARIQLLKLLKLVIGKSKNLVKVFATARNDPDIFHHFGTFLSINMQPSDNCRDIQAYVEAKVMAAIADVQLLLGDVSDDFKVEICDSICKRSDGM